MSFPSDPLGHPLVLDASVLLNLVATQHPRAVLNALGTPIVVAEAASEVTHCPRTGRPSSPLKSLLGQGLRTADLEDDDAERFVELISAVAPDELADGEAATLAYATRRGYIVATDEPKAHRVLERRFNVSSLTTVDIYRLLLSSGRLERPFVGDCMFDSLRFARMRVKAADIEWSRAVLGPSRIAECAALLRV